MDYVNQMTEVARKVAGNRTNLYKTLAAIYGFGLEAMQDKDAYDKYVKEAYAANDWKKTAATMENSFTPAVRLAFNCKIESEQLDAQPISKYASALKYLEMNNVGYDAANDNSIVISDTFEQDVIDTFKDKEVGGISGAAKKSVPTLDDDDDGEMSEKQRAIYVSATTWFVDSVLSDDEIAVHAGKIDAKHVDDEGYVVVLAQVVDDKMAVIQGLPYGKTRIEQIVRSFAPSNDNSKNSEFSNFRKVLTFAEAVKLHKSSDDRLITIDNQSEKAIVHVSGTLTKNVGPANVPVAMTKIPRIEGLPEGIYLIYKEEAEAIKKLWSKQRSEDWEIADEKDGPALMVAGKVAVQMSDTPDPARQPVTVTLAADEDYRDVPAETVDEFLKWVSEDKPGAGEVDLYLASDGFAIVGEDDDPHREFAVEGGFPNATVTIRLGQFTAAIRKLKSLDLADLRIGVDGDLLVVAAGHQHDHNFHVVVIPTKSGVSWNLAEFHKVASAFDSVD